jgi:alpha-amylase/alpha-mannosidase (GH57 family)
MERYICIHCHFYQPPRENPWLESIEVQDSAYPYHDWNERITAECYGPNSASRIVNAQARVTDIVSNYSKISFNFGPTLLSWMADKSKNVYEAILEADRQSVEERSGHGNAIAQVYNHMIMPLANRRDKETQVRWGIRDFESRFGRFPEGMWLAETAVDYETLECLAREGIKFTILAPHQAKAFKKTDGQDWQDVTGGTIDPTRPYLCYLPSGASIVLFFYDGPVSRGIAFENLLSTGENLASRLASGFSDTRDWPQLMHIATDGETYGHHKRFGDMALAFALRHIEESNLATLTNYGEYLEKYPPDHEVEIYENSSWSCAHGIERWRSDCGCNSGGNGGWNQAWRAPLRNALNWLRDEFVEKYNEYGSQYLNDPWAARDRYIDIILNRHEPNVEQFLAREGRHEFSPGERIIVLKLLEMQRHCMLMFTSCGWFFDELSGIETVQVIEYAGRAIQLMSKIYRNGEETEQKFKELLGEAKSNIPEHKDGAAIYEKWVKPASIDLNNVAIHYAISSVIEEFGDTTRIFSYTVDRKGYTKIPAGNNTLIVGNAVIISEITGRQERISFSVLHLGGHIFNGGARTYTSDEAYETMKREMSQTFEKGDIAGVVHAMDSHFGMHNYSLQNLFRDTQHKILKLLLKETLDKQDDIYRNLFESEQVLMNVLAEAGMPVPSVFRAAAEYILNLDLVHAFGQENIDPEQIKIITDQMRRAGLSCDADVELAIKKRIESEMNELREDPVSIALMQKVKESMDVARLVPVTKNLWDVQNIYFDLIKKVYPDFMKIGQETGGGATHWIEAFKELGEALEFDYDAIVARQGK